MERPSSPEPPYNLLIVMGRSPQVITETVFELRREEKRWPAAVHVITTRSGRAFGEAKLLGKEREDPLFGGTVSSVEPRWLEFCDEVLGLEADEDGVPPVDLTFHVPEANGRSLDDIRQKGEDTRFANLCYRLVERLTREEDALQLIGSIAGGRKTMSAHLMTAFSIYGRRNDRLTHVLLSDPDLENEDSFFYPEVGSSGYSRLLDLVDIQFPKLHGLLKESDLPDDGRDPEAVLDASEPRKSVLDVARIRLELTHGGSRLLIEGDEEKLASCSLTPKDASTLAVFADARGANGAPVPTTALIGSPPVEEKRAAILKLCGRDPDNYKKWSDMTTLSQSVMDGLNPTLKGTRLAYEWLEIQGLQRQPRLYDWPRTEEPPLEIATGHSGEDWPFDYLPEPSSL